MPPKKKNNKIAEPTIPQDNSAANSGTEEQSTKQTRTPNAIWNGGRRR
jgi:hypothetical protein